MPLSLNEISIIWSIKKKLQSKVRLTSRRLLVCEELMKMVEEDHNNLSRRIQRERYEIQKAKREKEKLISQFKNKLILNIDDIVLIKGTRDHGIRQIISLEGEKIRCQKVITGDKYYPFSGKDLPKTNNLIITHIKTLNDISKISHILDNDNWIPITEIL